MARSPSSWGILLVSLAAMFVLFTVAEDVDFRFVPLLLPALLAAALRFGFVGAALASSFTQVGLIVGSQLSVERDATVFELQALMTGAGVLAMLVGAGLDRRRRRVRAASAEAHTPAFVSSQSLMDAWQLADTLAWDAEERLKHATAAAMREGSRVPEVLVRNARARRAEATTKMHLVMERERGAGWRAS